jgi:hypothetical protein
MKQTTPQPSRPFERDSKWYFTYYMVKGPVEYGPYPDEASAEADFVKALRIHEANGYTDGDVSVIN